MPTVYKVQYTNIAKFSWELTEFLEEFLGNLESQVIYLDDQRIEEAIEELRETGRIELATELNSFYLDYKRDLPFDIEIGD